MWFDTTVSGRVDGHKLLDLLAIFVQFRPAAKPQGHLTGGKSPYDA